MNLWDASSALRTLTFRIRRALGHMMPGGRIEAFGSGRSRINSILVVNLDRQPRRWRRVLGELGRFRTACGAPLTNITRRLPAVDAVDGRAVAATADVDPIYRMGDQLFVQPNARLQECFGVDEPIRMTRQEVAVARSHIEAWKFIANGTDDHVLVLEDDVWFASGAAAAIDRGWRAARQRCGSEGGPRLLYLSYKDADGTAERVEACDALFHPTRGLWFLSGYVLSRSGARALLQAMPVVGPVDLWMNYRFPALGALALSSPAILQREDGGSDNSYSILPYLARAGIVDAGSAAVGPDQARNGLLLAWTARGDMESLPMALSMLGLRVRAFDGDEKPLQAEELAHLALTFNALVDAPLTPGALGAAVARRDINFVLEGGAAPGLGSVLNELPGSRTAVLSDDAPDGGSWKALCSLLGLAAPAEAYPVGTPRAWRAFRDDRASSADRVPLPAKSQRLDLSPWVLPAGNGWQPWRPAGGKLPAPGGPVLDAALSMASPMFRTLLETFPGNLASFAPECLVHGENGAQLTASPACDSIRQYRSGAFASVRSFPHGRFEAEVKAAPGAGLVTGFFLHRDAPRQEIDIELIGGDPRRILVNAYFNPGDDGAALGYGYRGSPCRIELGFDTTEDFHIYSVDWRPGRIAWLVDGTIVHERVGWDPTPIPHLPMRLYGNLWVPRSEELAGRLASDNLPATATFRRVSVWS